MQVLKSFYKMKEIHFKVKTFACIFSWRVQFVVILNWCSDNSQPSWVHPIYLDTLLSWALNLVESLILFITDCMKVIMQKMKVDAHIASKPHGGTFLRYSQALQPGAPESEWSFSFRFPLFIFVSLLLWFPLWRGTNQTSSFTCFFISKHIDCLQDSSFKKLHDFPMQKHPSLSWGGWSFSQNCYLEPY